MRRSNPRPCSDELATPSGGELLTGAIVDRIAYKAHVVDMTGESYRVLETEARIKQAQKKTA